MPFVRAHTIGRISLFVIYFWFGALKLFGISPASPLVNDLLERTLPFISPELFLTLFALYEMLLGVLFLFPRLTKIATVLFAIHMITTVMPLVLLPQITWQSLMVPTLEGQYIIKNMALIAVVVFLQKKKQ